MTGSELRDLGWEYGVDIGSNVDGGKVTLICTKKLCGSMELDGLAEAMSLNRNILRRNLEEWLRREANKIIELLDRNQGGEDRCVIPPAAKYKETR